MLIELSQSKGGDGVTVEILDRPGPIKEWQALDDFSPAKSGNIQINSESIEAKGCGLVSCWEMHNAVWGELEETSNGTGMNMSSGKNLPEGEIYWRVISV